MAREFDFEDLFSVEVDGWCLGIQRYPGEIYPGLVHSVLRELAPSYRAAIRNSYSFDLLQMAQKISKASKYLVSEKEICFATLAYFPNPADLDEAQQFVMAQIIDQVEQNYGGALERLKRKWQKESARTVRASNEG
jgi:hypothetical protein